MKKFTACLDNDKSLDKDEVKPHTLDGDEFDCGQKDERKERPYSGSGKPNSISSVDWRGMMNRI